MARPDYAATLDRHAGKSETLAGSIIVPTLDAADDRGARGRAHVEAAAMHGNRWPALYGGFLFDLAYRACALAMRGRPVSLELHFLRAVRRADVSESEGLEIEWRVADGEAGSAGTHAEVTARSPELARLRVLTLELGAASAPLAHGIAVLDAHGSSPHASTGKRLVLPAHDAGWRPGAIRGRCLELPGSLPAIADTVLAKAMATVRGDDCAADMDEHFLVRSLSYWWIEPVDDALASFDARVVQRGRRMALAVGSFSVEGRVVGRTAGTIAIQRVSRDAGRA